MEEETQKIGELFVVHYYTQMHTDPSQMHRFYLDESIFTRGGPEMGKEKSVKGQKAINEKILSLGLQQVHTKIRQVDCHETIRNSIGPCIAVQVTGELSVSGHPMRPFVQTFVLAQVSERKYYIHNDIFRYQIYDEDFVSEGDGNETSCVVSNPLPGSGDEEIQHPEQQEVKVLPPSSTESREQEDEIVKVPSPVPPSPQQVMEITSNSWGTTDHFEGSSDTVVVQANGLPEDEQSSTADSYPTTSTNTTSTDINEVPPTAPPISGPTADDNEAPHSVPSNLSWAAKLKSAKGQTSAGINSQTATNSGTGNKQFSSQPARSSATNTMVNSSQPLPQREPKTSTRKPLPNTAITALGGGGDVNKSSFDSKNKSSFVSSTNPGSASGGFFPSSAPSLSRTTPDTHQIFVGNLPNDAKEHELKYIFKSYGNVIEVRINPKNFGFIVFDGEAAVQTIMAERSETVFMLHDRRLNIEEKRPSFQKSFQNNSGNFGGNSRVFNSGTNRMQRSGGGGNMVSSRPPPRR